MPNKLETIEDKQKLIREYYSLLIFSAAILVAFTVLIGFVVFDFNALPIEPSLRNLPGQIMTGIAFSLPLILSICFLTESLISIKKLHKEIKNSQ